MEEPAFIKKFNEKRSIIEQEIEELITLIQLAPISFPGHFKPWLVGELKRYSEHWDRSDKLIKLCRAALLKKDWKLVRSFLIKCSDEDRKKREWLLAERKRLGLSNSYTI